MSQTNAHGQPVGAPVTQSFPRPWPPRAAMTGRTCTVVPADPKAHAGALFRAYAADAGGRGWTYMPYGPFRTLPEFQGWMRTICAGDDPMFSVILDATGAPVGLAAYLRIKPDAGVIEVGHIHFSPRLQGTVAATEAMYLMMRQVFEELGYRRYEWKCDALNAGSRRAAERLGFRFEGVFRQATHYKGRNRDTAWYAVIDGEWPVLRAGFEAWLAAGNFDGAGRQRNRLHARLRGARAAHPIEE